MHKSIRRELKKLRDKFNEDLSGSIAELGALNISGSPREYLPPLTGFDLVEGKDVDVKIEPGVIPERYHNQFDVVISSSSFHYCPKPELYKKQITDLLKVGGLLWMSMCSHTCIRQHATSGNDQGFKDCFRITRKQLKRFLGPEIKTEECYYTGDDHHQDIIFIGRKTKETTENQYQIPAEQFRPADYKRKKK